MNRQHFYAIQNTWTGNTGEGTKSYTSYERSHILSADGKNEIVASSDSSFRGDAKKYNPEELFLCSISSCHMLWYLHLCADNGITVMSYHDEATGIMEENMNGGKFVQAVLKPHVKIREADKSDLATRLHEEANRKCYIANSCNFPIIHEPSISII
ncbi:MAG: OsmC family protein [Ferruginibacter sp.]